MIMGSAIKDALTRKIGPLPAWGWLGIGGVALWWYRNKMSGSGSATAQTATSDQQPLAYYGPYGQGGYAGGGGFNGSGGGGSDGGSNGTTTPGTTPDNPAPTITVNPPNTPAATNHKRKKKPKAQHKTKPVKGPTKPSHHTRPRSHATHPGTATRERLVPVSASGPTGANGQRRNVTTRISSRRKRK